MTTRVCALVLACVATITTPQSVRATNPQPSTVHHWVLNDNTDDTGVGPDGLGTGLSPITINPAEIQFIPLDASGVGGVSLKSEYSDDGGLGGLFLGGDGGFGFSATNGFTFMAWVRHDEFQFQSYILYLYDHSCPLTGPCKSGATDEFIEMRSKKNRACVFRVSSGGQFNEFVTPSNFFPPATQWAHVAVTATAGNPSTWTLYSDGETQNDWTTSDGVAPTSIHRDYSRAFLGFYDNKRNNLHGALRDVYMDNRVLTGDEIEVVMAGTKQPTPSPTATTSSPSASPSASPTSLVEGFEACVQYCLDEAAEQGVSASDLASVMMKRITRDASTGACTLT